MTTPDWISADIRQAGAPPAGRLDLWLIDLDAALHGLDAMLNEEERARAARLVQPHDQRRFAAARSHLRALLGACLQRDGEALDFSHGPWGKPGEASADAAGLAFNLAHSANLGLIGVARTESIGVDIEAMRKIEDWRDLAEENFAPGEQRTLFAAAAATHFDSFFATWTRKEAVIKLWGQGLSANLESFEVTTEPHGAPRLLSHNDNTLSDADLWSFQPRPGFWGAAAAPCGAIESVRFFKAAR